MGNTSVKPHPRSRHKKQVHWKAADRPAPPGKPQLVAETEVTPDVVTIRWDPPRYDGGSPITGYLVEHRRYGSPHWVRATPLLVPFNELSLSGLEPGWRYQFRISAENAVGLSTPGELSELLTVTLQRSAVTAPRFIDELKDTVALENEKVEFIANFLGQPAPKVCWFKDGFEIFSSRRIRIITENDRSVLTIHQSSLSDEGEIKCTATNRAGHASTRAQLTLEAPPSIRLPRQYEDGLLFELGEVMRLKVSIAGRPAPLVFWSHNNDSIKSDDQSEIETTDKYSSVRVEEVQRTDRGEYQVKAVNKLGEAVASFLVTVTDKPSPPGQARVIMTLGRSVTLSWGLPNDDGGCKIGNYIVEYFRLGWDVWLKAATCRQLTTTIGDLIEGSEYKFRIKAESPYGISEPSNESDVIFIPDPKRGIFTPTPRSRSQPREIFSDEYKPVARKRKPRSQSSTRVDTPSSRPTTPLHFYEGGIPIRPARSKVKSPSITPEPSPLTKRRTVTADNINKSIFDRASMARDLSYGSPGIQVKKTDIDNIIPSHNSPYNSEKLNQLPSTAVQSTVNVIHHQNLDSMIASNVNRRASSPVVPSYLQKAPSPISISPTINTARQRQKSPSPRPMSPTSESKYYQTQMPSSPRPMSPPSSRPMSPTNSRPMSPTSSRPMSPTSSRHMSPTSSRPMSPTSSRPMSPTSSRHMSPTSSKPMSPTSSRPMSPTSSKPMSHTSSRPMSPNLESNPYKRRRSPSPRPMSPPPEAKAFQKQKSPSPTPVKNIYQEQRPLSPKLPAYEMYQKEKNSNPSALPLETKNQQLGRVSSPHTFINDKKVRASSPLRQTDRRSPSPIRFIERMRSKSPSPLRSSKSRSPSPVRQGKHEAFDSKYNQRSFSKRLCDKNDPLSNSSEFMLVLLPDKQRGRGSTSDIKFDFDENAVPPPMSLSAPELGAEPLIFEPLRLSVSSTELLHEYAMSRFYDALAAEEAELEERAQSFDESNRKVSVDIPKIQINSKDDQIIVGLERKNSLRRRLSAGAVAPQQLLWAQRRHSLRNTPDLSEIPENNLRKFPMMLDNKSIEEASEEEINLGGTLRKFPLSLDDKREIFGTRQRSESEEREEEEFEKVRAKMAAQKKERKGVGIVREEDWDVIIDDEDREYEESLSESETESSEDERLSPEMPPLYVEEEETTYHPGLMHRTVQNKQKSKSDAPFEILTKPNPLPDPNFKPKPILKRRDIDDIPEKPIRKSINTNNTQQRSLSMFPQTNTKAKEARYDLESSSRQRSFSLFPQNSPSAADREVPTMRKRGSSPTIPSRKLSAVAELSGMAAAAASIGMPQPQKPHATQKKPDEEIKVVVEHYGDIVRSYGQKKRTAPRVYLNADDLKAAADRQSREDLREIARSIENLAKQDSPIEENIEEPEFIPNDTNRRRSFVVEASTALFRTVKESVSAVLSGGDQQDEDDTIPPDAEITPSSQRRGSAQINKRRPSRSPNKLETAKSAKKAPPMKSNARGENWSNLRAPSPNPQGRKSSPSPMRRISLAPPATAQARRNSLTGITSGKPKTKETTTQTAGDDSVPDPKSNVLLAAKQEELSAKAEIKVRTTVDYITDLAMFVVACWLYLFQNELLAIPVLLIMVYRQLKEEIRKKLPRWMFGTKKAKRK